MLVALVEYSVVILHSALDVIEHTFGFSRSVPMICYQNKVPRPRGDAFPQGTRQTSLADISLNVEVLLLSAYCSLNGSSLAGRMPVFRV